VIYTLGPRARRVYTILRDNLLSGEFAPGAKLPSHTQLAAQFGVATLTVRRVCRDRAVLARWRPQTGPGAPDEAVAARALSALRDLQGEGRPDLLAELIAVYLRDTPPRLAALREAVARADAEVLRREVHGLKGSSSQIGAVQMAHLCTDLEGHVRTADLTRAAETLRRLDAAFGRVRAHLLALAGGGSES